MKKLFANTVIAICIIFIANTLQAQTANLEQGQLQIAKLGNFVLENGQVIENCQLGYRTFGKLNQDRANAILIPTWLGGTSEQLMGMIGKDNYLDDSKWFIIAVDAFGNGISSSPSNYTGKPNSEFPVFTISDMVNSEYKLLTEKLELPSLFGVIGMSMGGHEVFEWIISHPSFVKKAVSIVGTPRMTGYEQLYWQTQLEIMKAFKNCPSCDKAKFLSLWLALFAYSAELQNTVIQPDGFGQFYDNLQGTEFNIDDYCSQIRALKTHDAISGNGGTFEQAARSVKSDLMIIEETRDLICNPNTAIEFTRLAGGQINKLSNPCGHISFYCEMEKYAELVRKFFDK